MLDFLTDPDWLDVIIAVTVPLVGALWVGLRALHKRRQRRRSTV